MRPTLFPSVPRVYEKVHAAVLRKSEEATGVRRRLIDWALGVGRRVSALRQAGQPVPRGLALQHALADKLVYAFTAVTPKAIRDAASLLFCPLPIVSVGRS